MCVRDHTKKPNQRYIRTLLATQILRNEKLAKRILMWRRSYLLVSRKVPDCWHGALCPPRWPMGSLRRCVCCGGTVLRATASSFHPCILVSKLNHGNSFPASDFINSCSNGCACEQIEGFVPRNRKDNNGHYTRSSISLEMTCRIPKSVDQYVNPSTTKFQSLDSHEFTYHTSVYWMI